MNQPPVLVWETPERQGIPRPRSRSATIWLSPPSSFLLPELRREGVRL